MTKKTVRVVNFSFSIKFEKVIRISALKNSIYLAVAFSKFLKASFEVSKHFPGVFRFVKSKVACIQEPTPHE